MYQQLFVAIAFILLGAIGSIVTRKLTVVAAITGTITGCVIYLAAGLAGLLMMATFFIAGTLATSWKAGTKERLGVAEKNKGRRSAGQVLSNSGTAGIASILCLCFPEHRIVFMMLIATAFATATADTISSELGTVYGRRFYNIVTFRVDEKGQNGVISLEGTLLGIAGSSLIAIIYSFAFGGSNHFLVIVFVGTIGNLMDSVLGATLERKGLLGNNAVNFISITLAAIYGFLLLIIFH